MATVQTVLSFWDKLNNVAKSLVALVAVVATWLAALGTDPNVSGFLPHSVGAWIAAAATVIGGPVLVWAKRALLTSQQVEEAVKNGDFTVEELMQIVTQYARKTPPPANPPLAQA